MMMMKSVFFRKGSYSSSSSSALFLALLNNSPRTISTTTTRPLSHQGDVSILPKVRTLSSVPGCSITGVANNVHSFYTDDKARPDMAEVYKYLDELEVKKKKFGYVAGGEHKEHIANHPPTLEVVFEILMSRPRTPVRVLWNQKLCADCHYAIKTISKFEERVIVVRDNKRFHHFEDGGCSCADC